MSWEFVHMQFTILSNIVSTNIRSLGLSIRGLLRYPYDHYYCICDLHSSLSNTHNHAIVMPTSGGCTTENTSINNESLEGDTCKKVLARVDACRRFGSFFSKKSAQNYFRM